MWRMIQFDCHVPEFNSIKKENKYQICHNIKELLNLWLRHLWH